MSLHRIVVVGGGAGGLELVTRLGNKLGRSGKARIILVDRYPTHIWKPLLHEVAAGSMDPFTHQLEYAAQARWHGFEFQQGELIGLDRSAKTITLAALPAGKDDGFGDLLPQRAIGYDTLVLAIGSTTHFFGVPGAQEHAIALDTAEQAERFRRRLIAACMRAQHAVELDPAAASPGQPEPVPRQVNIAIVGAGATGVELSAELRNTAQVLSSYGLHRLDPHNDIRITLIEAGPRILPALSERVATVTAGLLGKLNVQISAGDPVSEVQANQVITASGRVIPADLTVWAAGIKAPQILAELDGLPVNRQNQIQVGATLQSAADPDIFAFGDCASCAWPERDSVVPPRAQAAHQQASFLFGSLQRRLAGQPLPAFHYRDLGSLVSLGRFSAVGNLMGGLIGGSMFIEGLMARLMYTSLYRMHVMALHGLPRMVLDTIAHRLRRTTLPRVKLH